MKKNDIINKIHFIIEEDSTLERDEIIEMLKHFSKNQLRELVDSSISEPIRFYHHHGWDCDVMYNPKSRELMEIVNE